MLFVVECISLAAYAVTILLAFILGLARGKRTRKVIIHLVFFSLFYMIMLCWIDMTSSWEVLRSSDDVHIDVIRLTKNAIFSGVCALIITIIINKFSAYIIIHALNFTFAYFTLYKSMSSDEYKDRLTWLEVSCVLSVLRFFYILKEIIDGRRYNPAIAKTVVGFNLIYDILYYMLFIMSPYFQDMISLYSMNLAMSIIDLSLIPVCSLIVVHYNWISISQDYSDHIGDYALTVRLQRRSDEDVDIDPKRQRELMDAHHSYI